MKIRLLSLALGLAGCFGATLAATPANVNLTPVAKEMTVGEGELLLPAQFSISHSGLTDDMAKEIDKFIAVFNRATGLQATASTQAGGLISVALDPAIAPEGYVLDITAQGASIKASTPAGLFYAFQTVKKILPANVALGLTDASATYSLPVVSIADEPRYPWRGFELDVARHFFSVEQVKRMLDIMAVYKMNRFHWHLTDDQGWRIEMPKYPRLTSEAACPQNCYWWDFDARQRYTTNEMYGPHFYTVEQMKEVVEYARNLHIEVCPEVDLPGHMVAAIAAYPEFSCTPDAPHPVRYYPGVSQDVLDISNPAVVQFTKDIIDELASIFTYEYIHIGGDECPTNAWANSASCQQFKKDHGLSSDRALQNWLTKELADYAMEKHGRKLACWNEVITASGADKNMIKDADILIYAWLSANTANNPSKQAAELGLRSVWCSTSHYYLDYPQGNTPEDPIGMGGVVNLERTYNATPDYEESKRELYYGVNCNLWTEYIAEPKHVEYMALPRMIAVAETGWSPQSKKNFNDFKFRFNADTRMLDLGNYTYARHYVDAQASEVVYPQEGKFYRLITRVSADANRRDRCIELVRDGSPLIASNSAVAGLLWTNVRAESGSDDYDWQYWTFEADPAGSGKYAMVNRKAPQGSVNHTMQGSSVNATWSYDNTNKHYEFILGEHFGADGQNNFYSVRSAGGATHWLNCAQAAQNLKVNNWADPTDGDGGLWLFALEGTEGLDNTTIYPEFTQLENGKIYVFENLKPVTQGICLAEVNNELSSSPSPWSSKAWIVESLGYDPATHVQTLKLRNAHTGNYISALESTATNTVKEAESYNGFAGINNGGFGVTLTSNPDNAATIALHRLAGDSDAMVLEIDGKRLFAFGAESTVKPNGVNAREGAPAQQGATWKPAPVSADDCGYYNVNGTVYFRTAPIADPATEPSPVENTRIVKAEEATPATPADYPTYKYYDVTLEFTHFTVTYTIRDANNVNFDPVTVTVAKGETYTPAAPQLNFLKNGRLNNAPQSVVVTANLAYDATYDAFTGILGPKKLGDAVETVTAGNTYVIYDAHDTRHAYRYASGTSVYGTNDLESAGPSAAWVLEETDKATQFNVRNVANGLYVQALKSSATATLASDPYAFKFTRASGHWTIANSKGTMYWDGSDGANLPLVGWGSGSGHPYQLYPVVAGNPYFSIVINEVDQDGEPMSSRTVCVKPGSSYIFAAASSPAKQLKSVEGNEGMDNITENKTITVTYEIAKSSISDINAAKAPCSGIFDLQGRPVANPGHGIYIVNGKKLKL